MVKSMASTFGTMRQTLRCHIYRSSDGRAYDWTTTSTNAPKEKPLRVVTDTVRGFFGFPRDREMITRMSCDACNCIR